MLAGRENKWEEESRFERRRKSKTKRSKRGSQGPVTQPPSQSEKEESKICRIKRGEKSRSQM